MRLKQIEKIMKNKMMIVMRPIIRKGKTIEVVQFETSPYGFYSSFARNKGKNKKPVSRLKCIKED